MDYSPFAAIQVGVVVTRFGERVTRVVYGTYDSPMPGWFTPSKNKAHNAIHRDGYSVYFEIEVNEETRASAHPFDNDVKPRSVFIEQLGLFSV